MTFFPAGLTNFPTVALPSVEELPQVRRVVDEAEALILEVPPEYDC